MSVLVPPANDYSIASLPAAARASGIKWWAALPNPGWTWTAIIGKARYKKPFLDFSSDTRKFMRDMSDMGQKPELLCNFAGSNHSLGIKPQKTFELWTQYEAIGWLLYTYDQFLLELENKVYQGGTWHYSEYEQIAAEVAAINTQIVTAYTTLCAGCAPFFTTTLTIPLWAIPSSWQDLFVKIQQSYSAVMQNMTGRVEDYAYQKALAEKEQAEKELAQALRDSKLAEQIDDVRQETAIAQQQVRAEDYLNTLSHEALEEELNARALFFERLQDLLQFGLEPHDADNLKIIDAGLSIGITMKEIEAASLMPDTRTEMMQRIEAAAFAAAEKIKSGNPGFWEKGPTGYVYNDPEPEEKTAGTVSVGGVKVSTPLLVAGAALVGFILLRKK